MKKLLLVLFLFPSILLGQCDLELLDIDFYEGTYTIAFNNTNSCGGTGGPDGVSEIQIGFQAIDPDNDCSAMNQGWTFPSGITIPDDNNHPGWVFSNTSAEMPLSNWTNIWDDWPWDIDPPYYTGDTITFPLYNQYQQDCSPGAFWSNNLTCQLQDALQFWIDEGLSIQAVIWQISYGPTMYAEDGGWAEVGSNGDGTNTGVGLYEDNNFLDNWLIFGPCGEPFPEVIIDTVYVNDTIYVECPVLGCSDPVACNYNIEATQDDGSCIFCYTPYDEGLACNDYHDDEEYWDWYLSIFPDCESPLLDTVFIELPPDTILITQIDTLIVTNTDTTYIELPPDTIVQYDTIPVPINWYFYDTTYIYVELPPDTITVTEVDTLYITLPPDTVTITETEFIFVTDTIFETDIVYITDSLYITLIDTIVEYQFIEIDCSTGLPCSDLGFDECEPLTVYIPNAFTPNNDGYNDAWEVILDPGCWTDVILQVYSRWGNLVFESYDPYYLIWDGSNMGGSYYVPDGTYYWVFSGRKVNTTIIEELEGHITIFR
jgi:gliding motility-associated-like protein